MNCQSEKPCGYLHLSTSTAQVISHFIYQETSLFKN